jgi:hypothetical protein
LHHKEANGKKYLHKMTISTLDGSWGDFIDVYWILDYLKHPHSCVELEHWPIMVTTKNENAHGIQT